MPRKRSPYQSSLTDSTRPGGLTTMDVLMRWFTTPGNVKRWRMETHSPLVREVVEIMREEGLAHRKAPFVRYKLDAIEKQYITAKQWLLETGMHDAYMRGKASKEVKAHVETVCPQFKRLDPAFRGISFSKKNVEPIELDGDNVEDVEIQEKGEEEEIEVEEDSEEEENSDQAVDPVATNGSSIQATKTSSKKVVTMTEPQKRNTFRDRLFLTARAAQEKALLPAVLQKKSSVLEERLRSSTSNAVGNEEALTGAEPQRKTTDRLSPLIVNASEKETSVTPDELKKNRTRSKEPILSAAVEIAMEQAEPEAVTSTLAPAKRSRERLSKSTAAVRRTMNEAKKTAVNANAKKVAPPKLMVTRKRKSSEEPSIIKRVQKRDETNEELMTIEREALLKRVEDEEKQRHEVYKLERSKLECELESRQIQLLFEKASARKKLDQLGVSQEEIDRILPQ